MQRRHKTKAHTVKRAPFYIDVNVRLSTSPGQSLGVEYHGPMPDAKDLEAAVKSGAGANMPEVLRGLANHIEQIQLEAVNEAVAAAAAKKSQAPRATKH